MTSIGDIFKDVSGAVGEFLDITDVASILLGKEKTQAINATIAKRLEEEPKEWGPIERVLYEGGADIGIMPMTGMFVRPSAMKIAKVKELLDQGATKDEIWARTAVMKDPYDKILKEEISDLTAKMRVSPYDITATNLKNTIKHDELFERYPQLKELPVTVNPNRKGATYWDYGVDESGNRVANIEIGTKDISTKQGFKERTLHEIQHAIQWIEKWATGGSPKEIPGLFKDMFESELDRVFKKTKKSYGFKGDFNDLPSEVRKQFEKVAANNVYQNFSGEILSRETQNRANFNMFDRKLIQPTFEGISPEQAITRFQAGKKGGIKPINESAETVKVFRQGNPQGKWWSFDKEYAETFGKKGKNITEKEIGLDKKLIDEEELRKINPKYEKDLDKTLSELGYDGMIRLEETIGGETAWSVYLK